MTGGCPSCGGGLVAEPASGKGTVFTYTVNAHPFNPAVPHGGAGVFEDHGDWSVPRFEPDAG